METRSASGSALQIQWRVFVVCWAAEHASRLEGDFVECGVSTGMFSRAIVDFIDFNRLSPRQFYLLDTYHGIPLQYLTDNERESGHAEAKNERLYSTDSYEQVKETFRQFPGVVVVRGEIPGTLSQVPSAKVAYLSIDLNCAAPEIAAGEYFWPRLVPGAVVVLDDYGFPTHEDQKEAWDAFAARRGVRVLPLPTGQGLLLKPPGG